MNRPIFDLAEGIAGDTISLVLPVPAGTDPLHWRPTPDDVIAMQGADLILRNGAGYAGWLDRGGLPRSRMVDTSVRFSDDLIQLEGTVTHSHGDAGEHTHTETASITWLDFHQARGHAAIVADALAGLLPEHSADIQGRSAELDAALARLDERMLELGAQLGDTPLIASHPVYDYWARRYGLNLRAVVWEPDVAPDEAAMQELRDVLRAHPAPLMIWEGSPLPETVERLDRLGLRSVVFTPHANPESPDLDFLAQMRANLDRLGAAIDAMSP